MHSFRSPFSIHQNDSNDDIFGFGIAALLMSILLPLCKYELKVPFRNLNTVLIYRNHLQRNAFFVLSCLSDILYLCG